MWHSKHFVVTSGEGNWPLGVTLGGRGCLSWPGVKARVPSRVKYVSLCSRIAGMSASITLTNVVA